MACEHWCGYGLPPDDVAGWGFLVDDSGCVKERYKLSGRRMRERGLSFAWCTHECRDACITSQGIKEPVNPAPPVGDEVDNDPADGHGKPYGNASMDAAWDHGYAVGLAAGREQGAREEREACRSLFESINPASGPERACRVPGADAMAAVLEYRDAIAARGKVGT